MKKKIKLLCILLCGVIAVGFSALALSLGSSVSADTGLIIPQEFEIKDKYVYGETILVPSPSSVKIKNGSIESIAVSAVLKFPDGSAKREGNYVLDKTGKYSLTYYNANGVSATREFSVNKNYYGLGQGAQASFNGEAFLGKTERQGIDVTLKDGTSFSFNKIINVYDHLGELFEVCTIYPMFRDNGDMDAYVSTVSVKVIDCYDESKFVEFYIWCGEAGQGAYYTGAGASTQVLTGLEQNRNRPHEMIEPYDGQLYKIHRPQRYQQKTAWGKYIGSQDNSGLIKGNGATFIWDLSNQQMKVRNAGQTSLITDIDSTEIYGINVIDFNTFFTTGEVYLNIEAYNYKTTSFNIGVEKIFGMSGSELDDGILEDKKAPELTVGVEPTVNNVIYLQKGKPVNLPKIENVVDHNYYGDSRVAVFRNYGKLGEALVSIKDGVFIPEMLGSYTAVYTATDAYGNEGKYLLEMIVVDEPNLVFEKTTINKLVAAKENTLPQISASGLNREVVTSVCITAPNGETTTISSEDNEVFAYVPKYAGTYTVTYIFTDNVYQDGFSYTVQCVDENSAIFDKPFSFPNAFIKGVTYTIDPIIAYTSGNGNFKENVATVSVSVDGGAYTALSAEQMKAYTVNASKTLRFKATYGSSSVESDLYQVIDVTSSEGSGAKDYTKYFKGNYQTASMGEESLLLSFKGDANLQFINKISFKNFKLNFTVTSDEVSEVYYILRDASSPKTDYVVYAYRKDKASVTFTASQFVNGKLSFEKTVYTKYKNLNVTYSIQNTVSGMSSDNDTVGGVTPFAGDDALLEIGVKGATGEHSLDISQINNQSFSLYMRESKPQYAFEERNGVQEINSIFEIRPCYSTCVLESVLSKDVTVTVTTATGEIATSTDGVRLDNVEANRVYLIKLSNVGQYRVTYKTSCTGTSASGKKETLTAKEQYFIINVSEGVAPVITFTDGSNSNTVVNLKVGDTHVVKEFTVSDNSSKPENIKVYKMILDSGFMLEENGYGITSYTFKNKGEFIVYVLAYDELGNSSSAYYKVVVS